jgi:membrane protein YqaA with SNARE-associated domain
METVNWGYLQLCLVALAFGGLQVWWIGRVLWKRKLARPLSEGEFRKALERIWKKRS